MSDILATVLTKYIKEILTVFFLLNKKIQSSSLSLEEFHHWIKELLRLLAGQNHRVTITRNNKRGEIPHVNSIEKDKLELLIFFNIAVSSILKITVLQRIINRFSK